MLGAGVTASHSAFIALGQLATMTGAGAHGPSAERESENREERCCASHQSRDEPGDVNLPSDAEMILSAQGERSRLPGPPARLQTTFESGDHGVEIGNAPCPAGSVTGQVSGIGF